MNILVIQITGTDLVLARFSGNRRGLVFLSGSRRPLPDDGSLAPLLATFGPGEKNERVILALPPAVVHARELTIPIADRKKLRELLPLELAGEIASAPEELAFDTVVGGQGKALAVWCRRRDIARFIDELARCGLEPERVTASHLHWHLLIPSSAVEPTALTDGSALVVGTRQAPLMARPLDPAHFQADMARSIAACELATGLAVPNRLYLGGAEGESSGDLCHELRETFAGDRGASFDLAGAYAVARACVDGTLVDFRTGDLADARGERERYRRLRLTALLAGTLVLLLFGELGVRYRLVSRDIASLDSSIGSIYREVFPSRKKPVDPVAEVRTEVRRLSGDGPGRRVLPLLKKLAEVKGGDIPGFYEIEFDGTGIKLKGDATTVQAAHDFKARAASFVTESELSELKTKSDGGVSFVFRGTSDRGKK